MFLFGALGGISPTLASLGATFVRVPETPLPAIGMLYGLVIFAIIGGIVALSNKTLEIRQAIFAGIAAPAILMNIFSSAAEAPSRRAGIEIISSAMAQSGAVITRADNSSTLYVSPTVVGGASLSSEIPVTAEVKTNDGSLKNLRIGGIKYLDSTTAFTVPAGVNKVYLGTQPVAITGSVTSTHIDVVTQPTSFGDFLWALGAPRRFEVKTLTVDPNKIDNK